MELKDWDFKNAPEITDIEGEETYKKAPEYINNSIYKRYPRDIIVRILVEDLKPGEG